MEQAGNPVPQQGIRGKREMEDLTLATVSALEDSDLEDVIRELSTRVFDRGAPLIFDAQVVDDNLFECRFKPMIELVLYEIQSVARTADLSTEERRRLIRWVLDATGF